MFYFKTIILEDNPGQEVESAIRKHSSKRNTSFDFQSSASYITDDKYFLGLESKDKILLTRIRTPFERLLPKLILQFPKAPTRPCIKIRYSLLSTIVFCLLSISTILNILYLTEAEMDSDFLAVISLFGIFIALSLVELKLTKANVKAMTKTGLNLKQKATD